MRADPGQCLIARDHADPAGTHIFAARLRELQPCGLGRGPRFEGRDQTFQQFGAILRGKVQGLGGEIFFLTQN